MRPQITRTPVGARPATLDKEKIFRFLSSTPLFAPLGDEMVRALAERMHPLDFPAGGVLMRQGEQADAFYVVVSGRFRVFVDRGDEHSLSPVGDIGRGEAVGEMALLADEPRSATVVAMRDSLVLQLSKHAFLHHVEKRPEALARVTRLIISRLKRQLHEEGKASTSTRTIAVVPAGRDGRVPLEYVSNLLARRLHRIGRTTLLNRHLLTSQLRRLDDLRTVGERTLIQRRRLEVLTRPDTGFDTTELDARSTEWLHNVESSHDFVVYQCDPERTPWTMRCLRQADRIVLVARPEDDPALGPLEEDIFKRKILGPQSAWMGKDLVILHAADKRLPSETARWLQHRAVDRHHHVRMSNESDFDRLCRMLTGTQVALVLGGGGARGAAHVGVIQALEQYGIPIDMIAGTSFGAIMAAGPALGWNAKTLREGIKRALVDPGKPLDYTLPFTAITSGRKATSQIRKTFGNVRIEDLWLPFFCVSSNLSKGQQVVHRSGPLWKAIRTSVAIPGVLPPVRSADGDVLIDGGVMNNLPVDVMRKLAGGGKVLAVNVRARVNIAADDLPDSGVLSGWPLYARLLTPFRKRPSVPTAVELILRTAEMGNVISAADQENAADVTFRPNVEDFGLLDFTAYTKL
ncbi:MAG: patatin-like phospholipase family protein, partial [Pseudomonadota bacterium]